MAKWLGWVDNAGRERPRDGRHSVEDVVSHKPQVKAELARTATQIAARGEARLDSLPKKRTGKSQVKLEKHDLDWMVLLIEGEYGKGGSAGIEARFDILGGAVRGMVY